MCVKLNQIYYIIHILCNILLTIEKMASTEKKKSVFFSSSSIQKHTNQLPSDCFCYFHLHTRTVVNELCFVTFTGLLFFS